MIEYKFEIDKVECTISQDGLNNIIYLVHYRYIGTNENNISADNYGAIILPPPSIENFLSFEEITTEMVIGWLNGLFSIKNENEELSQLETMQLSIANKIELKDKPKTLTLQLLK